jgi:negative regulator of replication initiation
VEALANEWTATFSESYNEQDTEQELQAARTILSATKSSRTRLLVRFSDGTTLAEEIAAQTLAKAIERIGCERVASVGVLVNGENIASREKSKKYNDVEVPPYFIKTHSSTDQKRRNLEQISKALGLNLEISIL